MGEFDRRIKAIREKLRELPPRVVVHYADGTKRAMSNTEAISEVLQNRSAVKVECADESQNDGFFDAILTAVANVEEIWPEGYTGDTPQ